MNKLKQKMQTFQKDFIEYLNDELTKYDPAAFPRWIGERLQGIRTVKTNKKIIYFNVPAAFDIETSSFYIQGQKQACMYLWSFGLNGGAVYGRTWSEFLQLCGQLSDVLSLSDTKRLIVYVHNLSYEFQFFCKWFEWESVFALDIRKPVKALSALGIEFRCSYQLSGYSLAKLGDELQHYRVKKLIGALDYEKLRHSKTPLTPEELKYMHNDVLVVMAYIKECIENDGDITKIPLTKTGYVRNYCRNETLYKGSKHHKGTADTRRYRNMIKSLTLDAETYDELKRAFMGGFTHANAFYSRKLLKDVTSIDFTSSYPAVMVAKKYPMSAAEDYEVQSMSDLYKQLNLYCCLFDVEFFGLCAKDFTDHPLSASKCRGKENAQEDNGRIVRADHLITTVTEQDFFIYQDFYEWEEMRIANFKRFKKGYLPAAFVKAILKLYEDKTTLKGVEDKEIEYLVSKGMLNACYGMAVTDIVRAVIEYTDNWNIEAADTDEELAKYNKSPRRFLFYPWGVWVTAHARRALFTGIKEFEHDYVYADTDSIKCLNYKKHIDYIENYNKNIIQELKEACRVHGIDGSVIEPMTIKGDKKPLGVWDYECKYDMFKTLGAKRYMTYKDGKLSLTVSGVNKRAAIPYLLEQYGTVEACFKAFDDDLYIPPEATGKNTHTYIDTEMQGIITDYLGNVAEYYEKSGIHLEKSDYTLSLSDLYIKYLRGFKDE